MGVNSVFVVFDQEYGDKFEPEVVCSSHDQAIEWCLERWNGSLKDADQDEATDINQTPFRVVEVPACFLETAQPKRTDSEIIGDFVEVLNRYDGVFAKGSIVPCDEDIAKIQFDKYEEYELICEDGKLVAINES